MDDIEATRLKRASVARLGQGPVSPGLFSASLSHSFASSYHVGSQGKIITLEKS
jgi:hypothetical protein